LAVVKVYIVVLLSVLVVVVWSLALFSRPVSRDHAPIRVVIPSGASARQIANILYSRGLIRSRLVFLFTCEMNGTADKLRPGVYELRESMSLPRIIDSLVRGDTLESWVTIPEGFNIRQINNLLESRGLTSRDVFAQVALTQGTRFLSYSYLSENSLEGFLFPDTYLIARGSAPDAIITKMLDAFDLKVLKPHRAEIEAVIRKRFGLGPDLFDEGLRRIIILASLVEREAKIPRDRPLIAAVLWNRLAKRMRLEVDATVSYEPGVSTENKPNISLRDLASNSPYNTYRNYGLPPTPICNPGIASVVAVLRPADRNYLFYVAKPDGSHLFSHTFAEHTRKKRAIKEGKL